MSENVSVSMHGAIVEIRLDRVEKKNALTTAMYERCIAALAEGCERADARVFLISAAGADFTAGNDIGDFLAARDDIGASAAWRFIQALAGCSKPVIAAVQGLAVGIGTTMLLHCDLVYASPEASLRVPFVSMGLVPEAGSSLIMPILLGRQRAARMLLLGEAMGAPEALQAGLISGVVPAAALREHAFGKAADLAAKPPRALAATRALTRTGEAELAEQMRREIEAFGHALRGAEAREAFTAFLEKRAPVFSPDNAPGQGSAH